MPKGHPYPPRDAAGRTPPSPTAMLREEVAVLRARLARLAERHERAAAALEAFQAWVTTELQKLAAR